MNLFAQKVFSAPNWAIKQALKQAMPSVFLWSVLVPSALFDRHAVHVGGSAFFGA